MAEAGTDGGDAAPPVIDATGVHRTFDRELDVPVRALRGLELRVRAGEFTAIIGPSGCGKSTLINVLSGLETVDSGQVTVAGTDLGLSTDDERSKHRARHIGIVFQQYRLLSSLSALDNIAVACRIGGTDRHEAETRARDLLSLVALGARADTPLGRLSGGQRQRVAIARALANEPTVVLADEPTGALDSAGAEEIGELFVRLNRAGQTIVLVTHDPSMAARADRVLTMADGRLSADTEPVSNLASP